MLIETLDKTPMPPDAMVHAATSPIISSPDTGPSFTRDPELWFADGNIILCSGVGAPPAAFRVHKSLLTVQSLAWLDALTPSEHSGARAISAYRGVPIITFTDDVAHMRQFLLLMYSLCYLPSARLQKWTDTHDQVAGALHIATRYEMPRLRGEISHVLERDWAPSLEEWDDNERVLLRRIAQRWPRDRDPSTLGKTELDDIGPEPARVIALALACNVPSILPAAFYHLNRIYQHPKPPRVAPGPQHRSFVPDCLPAEALHTLLFGRESLARFVTESRFNVAHSACCTDIVHQWWSDVALRAVCEGSLRLDPLQAFAQLIADASASKAPASACDNCRSQLYDSLAKLRQELWDRLPRWFRVPHSSARREGSS